MPASPPLRAALLALAGLAAGASGLSAQRYGDPLVPRGRLRLRMDPVYTVWDHRFGLRTENGVTIEERERLGDDLTDPDGTSLFPGITTLESQVRAISGDASYQAHLGAVQGMVAQQITRIDFGADVGIFDWLTVGITVPWLRSETTVEVAYTPDSALVNLGISPAVSDSEGLLFFLQAVQDATTSAQLGAQSTCQSQPGSPECDAARALADRATVVYNGLESAYYASPFFPLAGSAAAASISAAVQTLSQDLQAAGHPGINAGVVYASVPFTEDDFETIPGDGAYGIGGAPLSHLKSLWDYGDLEVTATARMLSSAEDASVVYALVGGLLLRLPTGKLENPDVFLDLGWGDAQTDVEGRVHGALRTRRLALTGWARYGWQGATTTVRRVAPPEVVMPPLETRRTVRWSPAPYTSVDVSPHVRLTDALSLTAEYRYFHKGTDRFEILDPSPAGGSEPDPADLERESGRTLHQAALGLSYSSLQAWRAGRAPGPMEFDLRVVRAVSGAGGQTPVWTRLELGLHLFRRLWG